MLAWLRLWLGWHAGRICSTGGIADVAIAVVAAAAHLLQTRRCILKTGSNCGQHGTAGGLLRLLLLRLLHEAGSHSSCIYACGCVHYRRAR